MTTNDTIAVWGCNVCATIWFAKGDLFGVASGVTWLIFAVAIYIAARLTTQQEK